MNKTKEPKVIYCDIKNEELFDKLWKEKLFLNGDLSIIFTIAMALGFYNDRRKELIRKKDKIRTESLSEQQKNLINTIAIATKNNLEILIDKKEVYSIAEEYANGGIKILYNMFFGTDPGSPDKKLESDLKNVADDIINRIKK